MRLVAIGAVNVAISLYYYLMVVKRMYLGTPSSSAPITVDAITQGTLVFLLLGIFAVGIVQSPFLTAISLLFKP
jgi:NADH-quinone oxidoreductase subunit N